MSGKGKKGYLASGFAAICAVATPSHAVTIDSTNVELDSRVKAVREALLASDSTAEQMKADSWRVVSQFKNSSSWSNWNNCSADNTCPN